MAKVEPIQNQKVTHLDFELYLKDFRHICVPSLSDAEVTVKQVLPEKFLSIHDEIKNMEVFPDDIWVASHPKAGTTWAQEMVWLLNNGLDFKLAREKKVSDRYVFIEGSGVLTYYPQGNATVQQLKAFPRPRYVKTHLIAELLPDQVWTKHSKVVCITRNPKDAAVSFFHFSRHYLGFKGTWETFMDAYVAGHLPFGPFFDHFYSYWNLRNRPNVLIVTYEDMKREIVSVLRRVAEFLGKSYSDEEFLELAEHLSFEKMKENPAVNFEDRVEMVTKRMNVERDESFKFIRKGVVGSHKDEMTPELVGKFDEWINENLAGSGFTYKE